MVGGPGEVKDQEESWRSEKRSPFSRSEKLNTSSIRKRWQSQGSWEASGKLCLWVAALSMWITAMHVAVLGPTCQSTGSSAGKKRQVWSRGEYGQAGPHGHVCIHPSVTASDHDSLQRVVTAPSPPPSTSHADSFFGQLLPRTIQRRGFGEM